MSKENDLLNIVENSLYLNLTIYKLLDKFLRKKNEITPFILQDQYFLDSIEDIKRIFERCTGIFWFTSSVGFPIKVERCIYLKLSNNKEKVINIDISKNQIIIDFTNVEEYIDIINDTFLSIISEILNYMYQKQKKNIGAGVFKNLILDQNLKEKIIYTIREIFLPNKPFDVKFEIKPFKDIFDVEKVPFLNVLNRHMLILGETGSGKTYSAILPVLRALSQKVGSFSALIIDPKLEELKNEFIKYFENKYLKNKNEQKMDYIIDITNECIKNGKKIDLFEGFRDKSLDEKIEYLFKLSPNFLKSFKETKEAYWPIEAKGFITDLIKFDAEVRKRNLGKDIFEYFHQFVNEELQNYYISVPKISDKEPYFVKLKKLVDFLSDTNNRFDISIKEEANNFWSKVKEIIYEKNGLPRIRAWGEYWEGHFAGVMGHVKPFFDDWLDQHISDYIWTDPFEELKGHEKISIRESMMNRKILFFSIPPANVSISHYRVGQILKNKWFSFSFWTFLERQTNNIVVFYIADEFHRFITGDEDTGEQSFLDRCRAYGVSCILATQSISSLNYGIYQNTLEGNVAMDQALHIIINNCGTKLFFRTTDTHTHDILKNILPSNPDPRFKDLGHVVEAIPLSALSTGECYFVTPSGRWGRTKIKVE